MERDILWSARNSKIPANLTIFDHLTSSPFTTFSNFLKSTTPLPLQINSPTISKKSWSSIEKHIQTIQPKCGELQWSSPHFKTIQSPKTPITKNPKPQKNFFWIRKYLILNKCTGHNGEAAVSRCPKRFLEVRFSTDVSNHLGASKSSFIWLLLSWSIGPAPIGMFFALCIDQGCSPVVVFRNESDCKVNFTKSLTWPPL